MIDEAFDFRLTPLVRPEAGFRTPFFGTATECFRSFRAICATVVTSAMSAGIRYNPVFRTLGKALISLVSRIHAVGLSDKPQTCRTLVRLVMTCPRVRLLAEKNRISSRTIRLNSEEAMEHARWKAGHEFYNQTSSNCRPTRKVSHAWGYL
jgi:hypothetical protein